MKLTSTEIQHYSRHLKILDIEGQLKLKNARVLYIGAGGLGSAALPYLAAAGIGTLGIVDDDIIEISNLHRQTLYSYENIGAKKADIAQQKLQQLNPHINVLKHTLRLTHDNALELINQYDIIADGSDNFSTRYIINDACFHLKKPLVYASISQFSGQCTVFNNNGCYRCLFDSPPSADEIPNCAEGGVLGILPGVVGTIQATEVIKLAAGIGSSLMNRLLIYDALEMKFRELNIMKSPDCRLCYHQQPYHSLPNHISNMCSINDKISPSDFQRLIQNKTDFILVDVRQTDEYADYNIGGTLIPLPELELRISELNANKRIIVICKHGARSQRAVTILKSNQFNDVKYVEGGITQWMQYDDQLKWIN